MPAKKDRFNRAETDACWINADRFSVSWIQSVQCRSFCPAIYRFVSLLLGLFLVPAQCSSPWPMGSRARSGASFAAPRSLTLLLLFSSSGPRQRALAHEQCFIQAQPIARVSANELSAVASWARIMRRRPLPLPMPLLLLALLLSHSRTYLAEAFN